MGLAPFGEPIFYQRLRDNFVEIKEDGSFQILLINNEFHRDGKKIQEKLTQILGRPPRLSESTIEKFYADVAASIQMLIEDIVIGLAREAKRLSGSRQLCMAGGVALNCVANGRLTRTNLFDRVWVQPAAGDAGGALGAALIGSKSLGIKRKRAKFGAQSDSCFGPEYSDEQIETELAAFNLVGERCENPVRADRIAALLADGKIIGRFQGKMEFGPRALGNRSILADPRRSDAQSRINQAVKFRESWRPFAPAILRSHLADWFDPPIDNPYMLMITDVRADRRTADLSVWDEDIVSHVQKVRSQIPAVTHVDFSARVQAVDDQLSPDFAILLHAFHKITGCPILVNTSFNVRGEPIVCTPGQALRCFISTNIDALEIGSFIVEKSKNPTISALEKGASIHEAD